MVENRTRLKKTLWLVLLTPVLLLVTVLGVAFLVVRFPFVKIYEQWLKHQFWQRHGKFGRFVLFVYSDSPNWKDYVEENILPRIESHVITLNWSKRGEWQKTNPFEAKVFNHWAGRKNFNPMAILFPREGKVKKVRFWQAFRDLKHGKDKLLKESEKNLFNEVEKHDRKVN